MAKHRAQGRVRTRDQLEAEQVLIGLWQVIEHGDALLARHAREKHRPCPCRLCEDVGGLLYLSRIVASFLDGELAAFPEMTSRHAAQARRKGDEQQAAVWEHLGRQSMTLAL